MHRAWTPHMHHLAPCATKAPGTRKPARQPLRAQQEPAHPRLKSRRWGNPLAPEITFRYRSAGAMGSNRQKSGVGDVQNLNANTHMHCTTLSACCRGPCSRHTRGQGGRMGWDGADTSAETPITTSASLCNEPGLHTASQKIIRRRHTAI